MTVGSGRDEVRRINPPKTYLDNCRPVSWRCARFSRVVFGDRVNGRCLEGFRFDVLAAVRYLRRNGAKTVSIVGASFGGTAAAEASIESEPGEIDRLVLLAAWTERPEKLKGRKLFIVARDDANDDGPRLPKIRANYEEARDPKELIVLDGSAHAQFLFQTDQGERVMREVVRFLSAP